MVGFKDELKAVRLRLCGESSKREIIPIVGMGGSGKTTLARHIYDDKLTTETLDFRAWVTISQEYRVQDILLELLSIKGQSTLDAGLLIEQLYKHLKGRRYLIVLDDICDGEAWDATRRALPEDNNGSRVILTTRVSEVVDYVDSFAPLHRMHLLNEEQSWDLLHKKIFGEESCPPELVAIGRRISKKCKGLPLAIVVIAGVLSTDRTLGHWNYVTENIMSALGSSGDNLFDMLSLSYILLPHQLKPCFLYLGAAFPEDHRIKASMLIRLWIAEGLLDPDTSRIPEKVAEEYLEDLAKRNLVSVLSRKFNGKMKYCRIHDVLREWCMRRAQEEYSFIDLSNNSRDATHQRRIAFHGYNDKKLSPEDINIGPQVRTIMFSEGNHQYQLIRSCVGRSRLLRVLEARECYAVLPIQETKLYQLRYLAINGYAIGKLAPSVSRLLNLQTIILKYGFGKLPIEIWELPQLTHLIVSNFWNLRAPSARIIIERKLLLQNLQTLSAVKNLTGSSEIVNMLPNLKKLKLIYNEKPLEVEAAVCQLKYLAGMTQIETLSISFWEVRRKIPTLLPERFASLPKRLKELRLNSCKLPWESMTIIGSLSELEVLILEWDAFIGKEWETSEGEFCQLKMLIMEHMHLSRWIVGESTHFPSLKCLYLFQTSGLTEIPDCLGGIPTLERIELSFCNKYAEDSAKRIQKEQESFGNDLLQVHVRS